MKLMLSALAVVLIFVANSPLTSGSDHGDTPELVAAVRHDARLADLFAFQRGENLVLTLCSNPAIPREVTQYTFSSDVVFQFHIDRHSEVSFDNPPDLARYGGTILEPGRIWPDITIEVRFNREGTPRLRSRGLSRRTKDQIQLFTGLRDDPFIRGPLIGKNIAAVVIELPMEGVLRDESTLLIWATSRVPDIAGPVSEHAGRALRSQFPENLAMNTLPPRQHFTDLGMTPDVIIYDMSRAASFPNGRELTDDVVDLVGDPRILANDAPFPSANDVPFLTGFPYLAPPHRP